MQWPLAETICPEKLKKSCFYHKLPKGNDLYKDWLTKCTREDAVNCKSAVIYSDYFFPKGYEDGVKKFARIASETYSKQISYTFFKSSA